MISQFSARPLSSITPSKTDDSARAHDALLITSRARTRPSRRVEAAEAINHELKVRITMHERWLNPRRFCGGLESRARAQETGFRLAAICIYTYMYYIYIHTYTCARGFSRARNWRLLRCWINWRSVHSFLPSFGCLLPRGRAAYLLVIYFWGGDVGVKWICIYLVFL